MPALFLKKMVMGNFDKGLVDPDIADSIDFMVERVRLLSSCNLYRKHCGCTMVMTGYILQLFERIKVQLD
jgi:hypothetical protein